MTKPVDSLAYWVTCRSAPIPEVYIANNSETLSILSRDLYPCSYGRFSLQLADIVQCRSENGREYGVFLLPEGLIEFLPEIHILIAEINEILASSPENPLLHVLELLTPASRQVIHT